jgi:SOS-response transcriptional repressor LexA
VTSQSAFSWNSELPSGRNPFWIRDNALDDLGLHAGDAVSVDTRVEPRNGDLVVVEIELDGDSQRLARRYYSVGDHVRLEPAGQDGEALQLPATSVMVMGVIVARLRFSSTGELAFEEPIRR